MKKHILILISIALFGAVLRFTAINWDSYLSFHPDERNIAWAVTRIHFFDQMNPKFFAYGGMPIYLYRAIGEVVVWITKDPLWLTDWGHITVIGRHVSATLSTISILLIFLVGRAYFSANVGLIAACLLTFSPWAIREAHFATTETMLVFFLLLLSWLSHRFSFARPGAASLRWILLLGVIQGLALGAKTTSVLFMLIPLTAFFFHLRAIIYNHRSKAQRIQTIGALMLSGVLFLTITTAFFLATSPYTILDFAHFRESMEYESGVALGRFTVPYTLSFLGTPPYLYQFQTMLWQAGVVPILGFLGMIAIFLHVIPDLIRNLLLSKTGSRPGGRDDKKELIYDLRPMIVLLFPLVYFAWNGMWLAKFSRYNVPLLPFLTIFASWLLVTITEYLRKKNHLIIGILVYLIIGIFQLAWGMANWSIYLTPQTRVVASEWIYAHIPAGSVIYTEHWNDGLPASLPNVAGKPYTRELLNVYDADTPEKTAYYDTMLARGDYIILSTRRVATSMQHAREKYPITSRFYEQLFDGSLGYEEVATFTSYPTLAGITIVDEAVEESVQVFDHPTVRIFQNTKKAKK